MRVSASEDEPWVLTVRHLGGFTRHWFATAQEAEAAVPALVPPGLFWAISDDRLLVPERHEAHKSGWGPDGAVEPPPDSLRPDLFPIDQWQAGHRVWRGSAHHGGFVSWCVHCRRLF